MSTQTTSFSRYAGIHASKGQDGTLPAEEPLTTDERIAEALESIAHSLIALNFLQLGDWDIDSVGYEEFRKGWWNQT
jgi:hypothetical protein